MLRSREAYRQTVRGIREVSPEEEKEGYGGKDLQDLQNQEAASSIHDLMGTAA